MSTPEPVPLACTKRDPHTAHTWSSFGEQYACPGHERVTTDLGWWVISGDALLNALHRAAQGEDADLLYTELYANTGEEGET